MADNDQFRGMNDELRPLESSVASILQLPDEDQAAAFAELREQHPDQEHVLRRVEVMVAGFAPDRRLESFINVLEAGDVHQPGPTPSVADTEIDGDDLKAPETIGPYRIREKLGSGGMGVVYAAEQTHPVRRRVAVKVVRRGMATRDVLARFNLERRALAAMNHPVIAKVFDAGSTPKGDPYFAMEMVAGLPLMEYCDKHMLPLQERLQLFQRICAGVQHAHQKGVIHRDLKPGNILVSRDGISHIPKILDFGLAKATNQDFLEVSLYTERDRVLGTPEYMSPEQAAGDGEVIDVRSDVYSLGVILYELLTGWLPFTTEELRKAGRLNALHMLQEKDPPKPSTRLSSSADSAKSAASRRQITPAALSRACRGDLDWVVMRALEKVPERRYDSANALAMELQRYLDHEPVLAGPPSPSYRAMKLFRRYRVQFLAAGLILLTALIGAGIAIGYAQVASTQEQKANQSAGEAREQAALAAERARQLAVVNTELQAAANRVKESSQEARQLAGVVVLDRALAAAKKLYPAWPDQLDGMQAWLDGDVKTLRELRSELDTTITQLEAEAKTPSEEEREAKREAHTLYLPWRRLQAQVKSLEQAAAIRAGGEVPPDEQPPSELLDANPYTMIEFVWERVTPQSHKRHWGEELQALAVARLAVTRTEGSTDIQARVLTMNALTWALFAIGQVKEAEDWANKCSRLASTSRDERLRATAEATTVQFEELKENADKLLDQQRRNLEDVTKAIESDTRWEFHTEEDRFLHAALSALREDVDDLKETVEDVESVRMRWARHLASLRADRSQQRAWQREAAAVRSNRVYAAAPVPKLSPQIGLVPLGPNPVTGLHEYYHLRSAWDGKTDPQDIEVPKRDPKTGEFDVGEGTGIIFVLVPGGTTTLGARQPNPMSEPDFQIIPRGEKTAKVQLSPYLLARHELTKGQWERLAGVDQPKSPSGYGLGYRITPGRVIFSDDAATVDRTYPVENVTWTLTHRLLTCHNLTMPTEAQWEHACRAGTETVWFTGDAVDSLKGVVNLRDKKAYSPGTSWFGPSVPWEDGFLAVAPVDALPGNAFGLHQMHGNVAEWCLDPYGSSHINRRPGDGLQKVPDGSGLRTHRGGSCFDSPGSLRSAARGLLAPGQGKTELGVRPARRLFE